MGPPSSESRARSAFWQQFRLTLLALCWFCLLGCTEERTPDLLELHEVGPTSLEPGSELRITGEGFVERQRATLHLRGTLFSPGRAPRACSWTTSVEADNHSSLALRLDERQLEELLRGASHATFRGSLSLSFEQVVSGRPRLRGEMQGVKLNLFAGRPAGVEQAQSFLDYLGLQITPQFVVQELQPSASAAAAGLRVGDRLLSLDGVELDNPADFVPAPHVTASLLHYQRGADQQVRQSNLSRADFQLLDLALVERSVALILGVALALLLISRPPRFVVWLVGIPKRERRDGLTLLEGVQRGLHPIAYLILALVIGLYFLLLLGRLEALAVFDFLLVLSMGILSALVGAFMLGGLGVSGHFSLLGAIASSSSALWTLLPVLIAALTRAAEVGSLRLVHIERAQGVMPQDFGALQAPWTLALSLCYLIALVPLAGRRPPLYGKQASPSFTHTLGRSLEWLSLLVLLGLWISLFGGASRIAESGNLLTRSALFTTKLLLLTTLIAWLRQRSGYLRQSESHNLWGRTLLGTTVLSTALVILSLADLPVLRRLDIKTAAAWSFAASVSLLAIIAHTRSWMQKGRLSDPWL